MSGKVVAVAGATGLVGEQLLRTLEDRQFNVSELRPLASARSKGKKVRFHGEDVAVEELTADSFKGIDIALFSCGGGTSKEFAPHAARAGCVVVDNSSAWRMDPKVPLVVPEVNAADVKWHEGIIANPNCSTIQMVVVLKPIYDAAGIERVVVSTYQAVSGAGKAAVDEMMQQTHAILNGEEPQCSIFPHPIAFNCLPQIPHKNAFNENGYSTEENKMVNETKKIMGDQSIRVSATTVRVPVHTGHSESVNVETRSKIDAGAVRDLLSKAPGVKVVDDPAHDVFPVASQCVGSGLTFVGRIRNDISHPQALDMWIVSDNLLKGAAYNAVQIAELL